MLIDIEKKQLSSAPLGQDPTTDAIDSATVEYYASTEGNFSLYNCEGRVGAIGKIPSFLAHRLPVALLRFDVERGEPRRNGDGFCERCGPNEVGEAVGLIPGAGQELAGRFEGYADAEASARKVLRNVFKDGDAWYRTGDLMRRDEARLLLLRGPRRRNLSLEGRERVDRGSPDRAHRGPRRARRRGLRGCRARRRRPRGHGRPGGGCELRSGGVPRRRLRGGCRLMRGPCFCACCRSSSPPARSSRASRT